MQVKTTVIILAAVLSINLATLDIKQFLKGFFLHYNCLQASNTDYCS